MKLLFVHDRFGALAGAEANIFHTAAELQRRGHVVGLLHGPGTGRGEAGWRHLFSDRFALPRHDVPAGVVSRVATFRPDAIYVHKLGDLRVLEALVATDIPLVRMVHDHDLYCMRSCKYNYFTRVICRRALSPYCVFPCGAVIARNRESGFPLKWVSYAAKKKELELNRHFDRCIVGSAYMKQELLRNGFAEDKIEIHPPATNADGAAAGSTFSSRNLIVYAGQIVRGKGVDVLLEALARVRVPFECVIAGEGNHRAHCETLCRKFGLENRVRFAGFVPQEQLKQFYREASVAVLSSVWPEPFGAVGLEAMRYGLPVVAFDAGGIKEWLMDGHNGFLVPWMDRTLFALRVELLLRDKSLARQMGGHGRRAATQEFSFARYITGLENLFARVAGETREPLVA
jgi:glycosyltransferase involved in cell wall biosynthesis